MPGRATATNVAGPPQLPPRTRPRTRCATSLSYRRSSRLPLLITCAAASRTASLTSGTTYFPPTALQSPPRLTSLQSFKSKVHQHLRQRRWYWATDSLQHPIYPQSTPSPSRIYLHLFPVHGALDSANAETLGRRC